MGLKIGLSSVCLFLIIAALMLAGCGGGSSTETTTTTTTVPETTSTATSTTTTTTLLPEVAGITDEAFNSTGIYVESDETNGYGITINASEELIVCGNYYTGAGTGLGWDLAAWKITSNGSVDTSFGTNGRFVLTGLTTTTGVNADTLYSVIADPNGNILATGYYYNGQTPQADMVLIKLTPAGSLAAGFGENGIVTYNRGSGLGGDAGISVIIDSNNRILVAGYTTNTSANTDSTIWCYNQYGNPDTSFGTSGRAYYDGGLSDQAFSIIEAADGGYYVAGTTLLTASQASLILLKYNSSGQLDTSFGTAGKSVLTVDNTHVTGYSLVSDASGNLYVFGHYGTLDNSDIHSAIFKYNSSGSLVAGFGVNGIAQANGCVATAIPGELSISNGGYLYVTGKNSASPIAMTTWRFKPDGTLDTTFGSNGEITYSIFGGAQGGAVKLDSSKRVVIAGSSSSKMAVWRYR